MACAPETNLELRLPERLLPLLRLVVLRGIQYTAPAGISVTEFLKEFLRLDDDFIDNRIQTILLNGQPVDAPDETRIHKAGTLALSAAMPGLFGAAFRKGGAYRAMRQSYTAKKGRTADGDAGRFVTLIVKCFNQVAETLGSALLARGVCMDAGDFLKFWISQRSVLEPGCREARINGEAVAPHRLADRLEGRNGKLHLRAEADVS